MASVSPMLEITDAIMEVGGKTLKVCMQCGTCTGVCPWNLVDEFSPRLLIRLVSLGIEGYEQDSLWNCVTCATCVTRCPRGIDIIDVIRSTRSVMLESGIVPPAYRVPLASLRNEGNPWSSPRSERADWAAKLNIPEFSEATEHLLFACCTHAYDARNRKVLKETAELLLKGGASVGIIGTEESCCGDQAHKCGALETYTALQEANTELFAARGVRKIITTSPHCLNLFIKEYKGEFDAVHYTQVFAKLIKEKKLVPAKPVPLKVAYHDPCYLGRHNNIYDEPRDVLRSIPALEYVELPRCKQRSLCCGGGGGGIWSEIEVEKRFSVLRIREAKEAGANVIATACPFCMIMLEDGLKASGIDESEMKILDVSELLYESVE
ncbi:MAG: (Fe-S)-binding protein [Candidatus Abyssobacteria bacterium SURF_5]|uniref:(Fe-S)-binding protein n=1 Tax=Abyssobacteria bacterium (strain SURF_5) TaxID=2093360 RepID=A0A3A4N675_ABYX5|nr:MAG: (Fe-S)-binding protein [Candidatus Abyssubacteria bacterium SURF_5]